MNRGVEIKQRVADTGPRRRLGRAEGFVNLGVPHVKELLRRTHIRLEVGTLVVQKIEAERDGPCRDINFDPTVLPPGMRTSDDPFPAARSAAYARSYDRRTAEASDYPRSAPGAKP